MPRRRDGVKMVQLSVNMTPDTLAALRYLAQREGALPSAMARTAIVAWVRQQLPDWRPGQEWVIEQLEEQERARRERRP
jgi:hypothetical protein